MARKVEVQSEESCIRCGKSEKYPLRRGLCIEHYKEFIAARKTIDKDRWEEFEEKLIEMKLILPFRAKSKDNPYFELASQLRKTDRAARPTTHDEAAKLHAESLSKLNELAEKEKSKNLKNTASKGTKGVRPRRKAGG